MKRNSMLLAMASVASVLLAAAQAATPAAKPAPAARPAAAAPAAGKVCKLDIAGTDGMQYDKKELSITSDCKVVELTLKHTGKLPVGVMGHNWVLTKTADMTAVNNAGMTAGPANDHIAPGEKRVIAHTKLVGGGQSSTVSFPTTGLVKGGDYSFFCSFPGHIGLMKGKFIVK